MAFGAKRIIQLFCSDGGVPKWIAFSGVLLFASVGQCTSEFRYTERLLRTVKLPNVRFGVLDVLQITRCTLLCHCSESHMFDSSRLTSTNLRFVFKKYLNPNFHFIKRSITERRFRVPSKHKLLLPLGESENIINIRRNTYHAWDRGIALVQCTLAGCELASAPVGFVLEGAWSSSPGPGRELSAGRA